VKIFLFGRDMSVGEKVILTEFQKQCKKEDLVYCGEKVDLSKITNIENHNLIVVSNPMIFNLDITKIVGYVKKDLERPLVVVRKVKTFGAIEYAPNLAIERISTNKIYVFSGLFYVPKQYMKPTISEIFRNIDVKNLRSYVI
jgi:hypothetical protein